MWWSGRWMLNCLPRSSSILLPLLCLWENANSSARKWRYKLLQQMCMIHNSYEMYLLIHWRSASFGHVVLLLAAPAFFSFLSGRRCVKPILSRAQGAMTFAHHAAVLALHWFKKRRKVVWGIAVADTSALRWWRLLVLGQISLTCIFNVVAWSKLKNSVPVSMNWGKRLTRLTIFFKKLPFH